MDTKKRASGKTDGWGREEERLGEGGQWLEAIMGLEMGSELRRGEWRGKKKGEAALGDKGSRAYGARGRRGLRDLDAETGSFQPGWQQRVTDCVVSQSGDPLSPRGAEWWRQRKTLRENSGSRQGENLKTRTSKTCSCSPRTHGFLLPALLL